MVEICDNTDEELVRLNTQAMIGVFEKNLNLAEQAKEIMARYVPVKTGFVRLPTGAARAHHRSFWQAG